jgi:hypothetical protein
MDVDAQIYEAFVAHLQTFVNSFSPPYPVAYPAVSFTPPNDGQWLEVRFFPNETINYGLANEGPFQHRGLLQVMVCERPGGGITVGMLVADAVITHFDKGTALDPARVERRPWLSNIVHEPEKTLYPVTIPYEAMIPEGA